MNYIQKEEKMVNEEEYPSNSQYQKPKEESNPKKREVKKIVQGEVVERKPSLGQRLRETLSGDDAKTVGSYLFSDVIVPAFQDMLQEAIEQGSRGIIYGLTSGRGRGRSNTPGYTAYNRLYSNTSTRKPEPEDDRRARPVRGLPIYTFDNRGEAEEVLDQLTIFVDEYGTASVNDYKEMLGRTGEWTDDKWGWTNLRDAQVHRTKGGWYIDFPKPKPLS